MNIFGKIWLVLLHLLREGRAERFLAKPLRAEAHFIDN